MSYQIILLKGRDYLREREIPLYAFALKEQHKLRYKEVVEKCGWENVCGKKGEEADQYDNENSLGADTNSR
jgi:N-acyl-L-homoserine lactone synthetase